GYCGCSSGLPEVSAAGSLNISSAGSVTIQSSTLEATDNLPGGGGNVSIGSTGGATPIELLNTTVNTGSTQFIYPVTSGVAGTVTISGPAILVSGGGIHTDSSGLGAAGSISLTATGATGPGAASGGTGDALLLTGGAKVSADAAIQTVSAG